MMKGAKLQHLLGHVADGITIFGQHLALGSRSLTVFVVVFAFTISRAIAIAVGLDDAPFATGEPHEPF